jgi:N-acetylglucosamine-6-phosphate deacetylase
VTSQAEAGPPDNAGRDEAGRPLTLGALSTEEVRPELGSLDLLGPADLVALMAADSRRATQAVVAAAPAISSAVEVVCRRLTAGGRLIYVGAGTAGRLAVLDAAELGPTFSVPAGLAEAVIAGGDEALRHSVEGAEDDRDAGVAAMENLSAGDADVVIGVSASGRTPYVLGALERAKAAGAATIGLSCNPGSELTSLSDHPIELVVGGEVIAGSSRMNAGTAQKIALNTISTATMVLLGKTYGNLMVDLRPTNAKLRDRAVRIVQSITGVGPDRAAQALEAAGWDTKLASLVASTGQDVGSVATALAESQGRLRGALALVGGTSVASSSNEQGDGADAPLGATAGVSRPGRRGEGHKWDRLGVGAAFIDGVLVPGDLAVQDGVVVAAGLPGPGCGRHARVAAPGLVDLQVNGYAGVDVASASTDELEALGRALLQDGVLAYQPTLISGEPDQTLTSIRRIASLASRQAPDSGQHATYTRRGADAQHGAYILGAHLEGPFLSAHRAGAHPVARLRPPDLELARWLLAAGPVSMVTLAPELPGALELVALLVERAIVVSMGHSAATAGEAAAAVAAGASTVTHLFNAMPSLSARVPGLAGLALTDDRVRIQLIADGKHVADELVRLAFAAAPGRCSIVTDATSLAGRGGTPQMLGEVPIAASEGVARRPDGTIAGGTATLLDGLRHLSSVSIGLAEALAAVTERPARVLGRRDVGHLREGSAANLVVLDDRLELCDVLIGGRPIT